MGRADSDAVVDPITVAVVEGVLSATQRAMTHTMEKTGRSTVYAIARDYSNAIFDWDARMVLQGEDIPTHLGSLLLATKTVARFFEGDINPGDVFFHNDPTYDGAHIPDMCMYKPVFFEDELVFWAVAKGHVIDAGGPVPGTYNPDAKEIYAEGLRIPPIRIVDRGRRREDVINLILTNVRSRANQRGDMNAQFGAVRVAEQRLTGLLERFGKETVKTACEELLDLAEEHMRGRIAKLPDGVYRSSVLAEDMGHGHGDQELRCEVEVRGDDLHVRLDAPPQLDFFINSYRSNTMSGICAALMMFTQVRPPFNEGLYRPLHVDFGPPGTMVNAAEPAPHVNSTGGAQETICDLVRSALVSIDPTNAPAGWNHTWAINIAGVDRRRNAPYLEFIVSSLVGGAGAVEGVADGWECVGSQAGLGGAQIGGAELLELLAPVIVREMSIERDSAIPGRWRGGCSVVTEIEPLDHEMTVIGWGEGAKIPSASVAGAGAPAETLALKLARGWHLRNGEVLREIDRNEIVVVLPGERYRSRAGGGGGAGDPFLRPIERVRADVLERKVSLEAARIEYGVVLDPASLEPDLGATETLREGAR
ncbi:MAG: hydantoinase B/oxoprolinase family protein [Actinobacteria bacterium]|nr:hydantoinase B/oxoprolinase family protein [Actinomycetota bacterium]